MANVLFFLNNFDKPKVWFQINGLGRTCLNKLLIQEFILTFGRAAESTDRQTAIQTDQNNDDEDDRKRKGRGEKSDRKKKKEKAVSQSQIPGQRVFGYFVAFLERQQFCFQYTYC